MWRLSHAGCMKPRPQSDSAMLQAAGGAKAVASAETAANAAAAEAALERAKSRDMAARVAQLEGECATAVTCSTAAAEEAGRYRSTAGEFRKQAKYLEGQLAAAHEELQTAREHERRARQVRQGISCSALRASALMTKTVCFPENGVRTQAVWGFVC